MKIQTIIEELSEEFHLWKKDTVDALVCRLECGVEEGSIITYELPNNSGMVICELTEDIFKRRVLNELLVYVRKDFRGNPTYLRKALKAFTFIAKAKECSVIQVGSTLGYADDRLNNLYIKLGYKPSRLTKVM